MRVSNVPRQVLPVIVVSQFCATSLWFAANAVMPDLQNAWNLPPTAVGALTSAVQVGFVGGTFTFALLMVADRFVPTRVFLVCAVLGSAANALTVVLDRQWETLLVMRFAVGFLLAGIYPVGMRIAASWYRDELGAVMGILIGALVLGTALPHGMRAIGGSAFPFSWQVLLLCVSALATSGGVAMVLFVPTASSPAPQHRITARALTVIWTNKAVRASIFAYFGHMWELYTFYVLVPSVLATRLAGSQVSGAAFCAIASGLVGCVVGGMFVQRFGSARVAATQLAISGACALASPLMLAAPLPLFLSWLLLWGATAAGDSPQFSTLTAQNAPPELVGSVLTFANCVGFAITVASIELFVRCAEAIAMPKLLPWLALGPALGLIAFRSLWRAPYHPSNPAPARPS